MSKVICDICGTVYPESSENCPVCGCSRDFGLGSLEEELLMEEAGIQQMPRKKNKEIFDFDEVNQEDEPEVVQEEYEEEPEEEEPRSNTGLVVILLILIVLLLATAGFFFVRYFLPNMVKETEPVIHTEATVSTVPVETEPETTAQEGIPCTDIVIPGGKIELGKDGKWLMNVQVYPTDTTDTLTYASHDENIVTVNESGTVTAVGEGTTVIEVSCGVQTIKCNVVVDYSDVEVTEPAGTVPEMKVEQTSDSTDPTAAAEETAPAETEQSVPAETEKPAEATEAPKETTGSMELKLKKTDITMFACYSSVDLELDCDIPAEDIKWFTMDSSVAIVHNGTVTATGSGMTRIYCEYNGQQVQCIIRCTF